MDVASLAQPDRANDESGPHVARSSGTDPELVPRQGRDLQRCCRGFEQQDSSGDQKVLRLSDLRCYGNSLVSHARPTSRAGVNPQILLTRLKIMGRLGAHQDYTSLGADIGLNVEQIRWA